MKSLARLIVYLLSVPLVTVWPYTVPPGSPGFYHGNSTAAVTFDAHSLFLGDKRLYVFSGEVHTWRIPSGPALWRDVFEKMKVDALRLFPYLSLSTAGYRRLDSTPSQSIIIGVYQRESLVLLISTFIGRT
ncbi:hypothetical protein PHLCEN_2v7020 [Hermanssonia centrifuga]|uniref:Uncharacterized protein n=1 Tax=Hermanssonia centrifuga TaxID=98765 RepID=A0A2R6NXV0_9APHY|nr:hypothetical protein PHLCEN_2v7020 [Hermanssonia centrifuga]